MGERSLGTHFFLLALKKKRLAKKKALLTPSDAGVVRHSNGRKLPNAFAAAQVRRRCGRWASGVQAGVSDTSGRAGHQWAYRRHSGWQVLTVDV